MYLDRRKIKVCMAMRGMTVKALAENVGLQASNLSTIITRGTCRPETAARIAEGLGVSVAEIMKEE